MIVDFHTHTFPNKIAGASIERLSKCSGIAPNTDGKAEEEKRLIFLGNAAELLGLSGINNR